MKCKDDAFFKISHISIREAPNCTSKLKTGIVFVTAEKIESETLDVYNGLEFEEIQAKLKESDVGKQAQAFIITDTKDYQIELEFMALGATDW